MHPVRFSWITPPAQSRPRSQITTPVHIFSQPHMPPQDVEYPPCSHTSTPCCLQARNYIVATFDEASLQSCLDHRLPCYNATHILGAAQGAQLADRTLHIKSAECRFGAGVLLGMVRCPVRKWEECGAYLLGLLQLGCLCQNFCLSAGVCIDIHSVSLHLLVGSRLVPTLYTTVLSEMITRLAPTVQCCLHQQPAYYYASSRASY